MKRAAVKLQPAKIDNRTAAETGNALVVNVIFLWQMIRT
jgi:hypothetical protein